MDMVSGAPRAVLIYKACDMDGLVRDGLDQESSHFCRTTFFFPPGIGIASQTRKRII